MDSQKVDNNTSQKPIIQPEKERIQALLKNIQTKDIRQIFPTLRTLAYDVFIPWTSEQVLANKKYFVECEGIPCLLSLLKSENEWIKRMAGIACWNFMENFETTQIMYKAGAIPEILDFLRSPSIEMQKIGVGWLWGFLEYEELLDFMEKENVPQSLVSLVKVCDDEDLYRIVGSIQSLCLNEKCRKQLFESGLLPLVLSFVSHLTDEDEDHETFSEFRKLLTHHSIQVLAHFILDERYTTEVIEGGGLTKIRNWLMKVSPEEMAALEKKHRYLWQNFRLYYVLCESKYEEVVTLGVWSLCYLSDLEYHRDLMFKQNIPDKMIYFTWNSNTKIKEYATQFLKNFKNLNFSPPSLQSLSYYQLLKIHHSREYVRSLLQNNYNIQLSNPPT